MNRHFNTSGSVVPGKHYCIDPMHHLDWEDVHHLIATERMCWTTAANTTHSMSILRVHKRRVNNPRYDPV